MPWCAKCNTEYQDGATLCADCGAELVNRTRKNAEDLGEPFEGEALLVNVNDPVQLSYITSMLEQQGIPYRVIEEDAGQYLSLIFGRSFYGANIYVGADDYEQAADILNSYKAGTEEE